MMASRKRTGLNDRPVAPNLKQKGLKALDRQMLSYIAPPIIFPVRGFPGFCAPRMQYAETLKEPMLEVKRKAVLPRELRRIRASALTGDKKYGSVMDVLQIVYGQDFGAILKEYVDTHQEELYKKGIMPDSLFIRLGGIGKPYIETNYDQPSKAFFLDVVVDCLLDGEHYQKCVSFYIRYKMSFCAMDPRCFLWEIGLYRSDADDELRDTNRTKADGNLLPKITAAKYDEIVYDLLNSYNPEALEAPGPVDVYRIADSLRLKVSEVLIQDRNILGQMHFWPGTVEYIDKNGIKRITRANPLDIFINILSCTTMVAKRSSLAHEIGHVFCSRFFEFLQIMAGNKHGAVVNKRKKQPKGADIPKELESQPSKFSGHLLLPRRTALPFVEEEIRKLGGHASPRQMEAIVRKVMDTFQVSRQMATLRLKDFGYDVAKGVNRYVDGHYVPAYGTSNGEWKNGVDYIIEHKAVFELYFDDAQFREVINTGRFVFVENHLCLADRRFVTMGMTQSASVRTARLTDYARSHIDECCLAFRERGTAAHRYYDGFLNKEICGYVKDYRFDPLRTPEENAQAMAEYSEITGNLPDGFGQTLKYHMKRVKVTTEKLAETMEISPRVVYEYRKDSLPRASFTASADNKTLVPLAQPTKRNVIIMSLLMHQMPDWSKHFLKQAHYELDLGSREELAWSCAIQTSYMCEIEQINLQFRLLGVTALTSRFPDNSAA